VVRFKHAAWQKTAVVPLWIHLAQAEIDSGSVHESTYVMLNRLIALAPSEAAPLLIQIQARTNTVPTVLYDLQGLGGEVRLMAATLNARILKQTDSLGALKLLIEAWERFLEEPQ